jgi:hypothetical protein
MWRGRAEKNEQRKIRVSELGSASMAQDFNSSQATGASLVDYSFSCFILLIAAMQALLSSLGSTEYNGEKPSPEMVKQLAERLNAMLSLDDSAPSAQTEVYTQTTCYQILIII